MLAQTAVDSVFYGAYISNINGLVIITSGLFAIAQYIDNSHCKSIEMGKSDAEMLPPEGSLESSDGLRSEWEKIQNHKPLRVTPIVSLLFILLLLFIVLELSLIQCPSPSSWVAKGVTLLGCILLVLGVYLGVQVIRMRKELTEVSSKIASFKVNCIIAKQIQG